ncbi:hypothetical protein AQJ46_43240 [Streptomyces canus]|uniref:Uncharacterized protein n=1 Tax=Streptomyces canus TaxID=58343 RepID=A0A117QWR7_9ACTN|nr:MULTISPECIES: hypothetical protein [Streptomyces]KUN58333.1 hypothetical protein AQJ46_43240 [Streptomyces canus]MDI5903651.1 hypothetical protein [Streptomyces sp. 12257]
MDLIEQEERKTLTQAYDRKTTVTRTYTRKGFVGLLLDEVPDKSPHTRSTSTTRSSALWA